jgi:hypothetical protein
MRKFVPFTVLAVLALIAGVLASPAAAASGGGCHLQGSASFNPPLTNTDQAFTYGFTGNLSDCRSTDASAPATGTVEAGQVVTDPSGEQFQEPVPSGQGSCGSGTTNGTAIANWADGTVSVIDYSTDSAAAAVHLSGTVVPSVTLPAINPQPGQPTSKTITTTRYAGNSALGLLTFQPADPTACAGSGVTSAGIDGFVGLGAQ